MCQRTITAVGKKFLEMQEINLLVWNRCSHSPEEKVPFLGKKIPFLMPDYIQQVYSFFIFLCKCSLVSCTHLKMLTY